jgi:hypothetical protein
VKGLSASIKKVQDDLRGEIAVYASDYATLSNDIKECNRKITGVYNDVTKAVDNTIGSTYEEVKKQEEAIINNYNALTEQVNDVTEHVKVIEKKQEEPLQIEIPDVSNFVTNKEFNDFQVVCRQVVDTRTNTLFERTYDLANWMNLSTNSELKVLFDMHTFDLTQQFLTMNEGIQEEILKLSHQVRQFRVPKMTGMQLAAPPIQKMIKWDKLFLNSALEPYMKKAYESLGIDLPRVEEPD